MKFAEIETNPVEGISTLMLTSSGLLNVQSSPCAHDPNTLQMSLSFFHCSLWSSLSWWRTNPDISVSLWFSSSPKHGSEHALSGTAACAAVQLTVHRRGLVDSSCNTLRRLLAGRKPDQVSLNLSHTLILHLDRQVMMNTHVHFLDSLIPLCLFRPPRSR